MYKIIYIYINIYIIYNIYNDIRKNFFKNSHFYIFTTCLTILHVAKSPILQFCSAAEQLTMSIILIKVNYFC